MSRIAYVNGRYVPHREAAVHIEDRGYQFADGIYEVIAVSGGGLVDEVRHLERLAYSLGELKIPTPMADGPLRVVMREVLRRNRVKDGMIYLQVTRGRAPRDHGFPKTSTPALVMTARRAKPGRARMAAAGVKVITTPDIRWQRCDIKSISLLPNVLAKQMAAEQGAYEAWQIGEDGFVTEGSASNAWIITHDDTIVTRPSTHEILNGITRRAVIDLAAREGLTFDERPFTIEEALAAREAFLTSTTSNVMPVVQIDDAKVGDGKPGPVTLTLDRHYGSVLAAAT